MATSAPPLLDEGYPYPVLLPLVRQCLDRGVSVLLRGHPGVGKSALAAELAGQMHRPIIDIRLAQKDPAELAGVYIPNREKRRLELYPPDWVQQACEAPAFIFLDEMNAAVTKLHQSASYQIVLEHRVGPFTFHPETVVLAAGNLEEDEALAVPLSSALRNRFAHYILRVDADAWITWATSRSLSPDIVAYIAFRREPGLYKMTGEYAFPTPRSWTMAAQVDGDRLPDQQRKRLLTACVGPSAANEFQTFHRIYRQVDVEAILKHGQIPSLTNAEPGFLYALTFAVVHLLRARGLPQAHCPHLLSLLQAPGFSPEFQALLVKNLEGTKAFTTLFETPIFIPVKDRLLKLFTSVYAQAQAA
jgi:SpoVK/Ycf46/Vps4 family AAA+-type ATPase